MTQKPGYRLQIIDPDDRVVKTWPAGDRVERELVEGIVQAVLEENVGVFRTQAQVGTAVKAAVEKFLRATKEQASTSLRRQAPQR